jgi:hypothetical protein
MLNHYGDCCWIHIQVVGMFSCVPACSIYSLMRFFLSCSTWARRTSFFLFNCCLWALFLSLIAYASSSFSHQNLKLTWKPFYATNSGSMINRGKPQLYPERKTVLRFLQNTMEPENNVLGGCCDIPIFPCLSDSSGNYRVGHIYPLHLSLSSNWNTANIGGNTYEVYIDGKIYCTFIRYTEVSGLHQEKKRLQWCCVRWQKACHPPLFSLFFSV